MRGARQNNLQNLDLDLAKRSLIVVVGVSGSGKSSLVFDTIAAEAQRQINSTFSAFAQNYLPSYGRPDVDLLENLSAAVVIDQRRLVGGPRSTVATFTDIGDWMRMLWSRGADPHVGYSYAFSFNDPAGMCPTCQGLGREKALDVEGFLDEARSLREGPFRHPEYKTGSLAWRRYADSGLFDIDVPIEQFSTKERHLLLDAAPGEVEPTGPHALPGEYEGVLVRFRRIQLAKDPAQLKGEAKKAYDRLVTEQPCTDCGGTRLNAAARTAHIDGLMLPAAYAMQVSDLSDTMRGWDLGPLRTVVDEITTQLDRLIELGLGYLSLDRATATLSGGEAQRVRMVGHLGSTLNDMLYIFDEPTTGLHARDVDRLAQLLIDLRDKGNTVLVVEHDPAIMAIADQVIEIGPAPGPHGGRLVFQGSFEQLRGTDTPTGAALRAHHVTDREPRVSTGLLRIEHARSHNLRDVSVDIPLGVLTVVTGVAGSGKSSLIHGHLPQVAPDAVLVDQGPIRGSRRSTPASWTGMLDEIRRIYPKATGQPAGLFSPNADGGCRACEGTGLTFIDLGFADSVTTPCETCGGRRFRPGALRHTVDGLTIADVFELTIDEARDHFTDTRLVRLLTTASQVGLGYVTLGQNLITLSGGERQRLKLARELTAGADIIVLDEPTTGLHPNDTGRLVDLLHRLVDDGRTVIVIEHDLDVIAAADHVVDLGPDGGHNGGLVQFTGSVTDLARTDTHTGEYLRRHLQNRRSARA
ncbi:ATP-binding cassette domain-containing protein [Nigerium massiliense]|uniref:ATP-binding cassette domain-containing protein n=1 Tax=Nigerium massiliense TaxID=1522317 RepID=UPI000B0FB89F|nr:excinuclease ABC subunit UvrA [Nigerium massiliense]